jgi:hypothetical protein
VAVLFYLGKKMQEKEIISHGNKKETYEEFVDKFKPKKTTDDCYTPPEAYEAVKDWAMSKFEIPESTKIIRPFWPGGDYRQEEYPKDCVVIDNPPFSVLKEICNYYNEHGIKYVLFCPALTSIKNYSKGTCFVKESITYENGAKVPTAFTHNFSNALEAAPELNAKLKKINSAGKKSLPKYTYPPEVITAFMLMNIAAGGMHYKVDKFEIIAKLDSQKPYKKTIYGSAALVSRQKAEEAKQKVEEARQKAEKEKQEKNVEWKLSDREKNIVEKLGE